MEPRPRGCGDKSRSAASTSAVASFNGAAPVTARRRSLVDLIVLVDPLASMEPRSWKRGYTGEIPFFFTEPWRLQWSRAREGAETSASSVAVLSKQ